MATNTIPAPRPMSAYYRKLAQWSREAAAMVPEKATAYLEQAAMYERAAEGRR